MDKSTFYPLSFSSLKAFNTSPAHFVAYKQRQQHETPAMRFGTAVHCAVLEPEKFAAQYRELKVRRGTAAYKAILEEHPNAKFLSATEWSELQKIKEAVEAHPMATRLIEQATAFEQELVGAIYGHAFRGFADIIGPNFVVDLKTCQNSSPQQFTNDAFRMKYHVQAYIYTQLLGQRAGQPISDFWWIAVEKTSPFVVTCFQATPELIARGKEELERILDEFVQWDGTPRGYDQRASFDYFTLDVPHWAIK